MPKFLVTVNETIVVERSKVFEAADREVAEDLAFDDDWSTWLETDRYSHSGIEEVKLVEE